MSENLNEQVIVAFFADAEATDDAAEALMGWDKANDDIKLGSMGRITLKDGEVEIKRYGTSKTGRGAVIGGVLGAVAAGVTGGLSLLAGAVGGGLIGGAAGKLDRDKFGLSESSLAEIEKHLGDGGAGLVVLCDGFEVEPTMQELTDAGGTAQAFGVSTEVLNAIRESQIQEKRWSTQTDNIERSV